MSSRWILALSLLLLGCDSGSKEDCVVPKYPEACCCAGDVVDFPTCSGGDLTCRQGMKLHHGDECQCLADRETPCCLPHVGYDAGVDTSADTSFDASIDTPIDAPPSPSCPTDGRLPTPGTACDPKLMPSSSYCRLLSCDWGGEGDCRCDAGVWRCAVSARDGWGCGTPPRCFEPGTGVCTGADESGACLDGTTPLYAQGPWDASKGCWPTTRRFFDCVSPTDAPAPPVCFAYHGSFYLGSLVPYAAGGRPCTDAETAAHVASNRCE